MSSHSWPSLLWNYYYNFKNWSGLEKRRFCEFKTVWVLHSQLYATPSLEYHNAFQKMAKATAMLREPQQTVLWKPRKLSMLQVCFVLEFQHHLQNFWTAPSGNQMLASCCGTASLAKLLTAPSGNEMFASCCRAKSSTYQQTLFAPPS